MVARTPIIAMTHPIPSSPPASSMLRQQQQLPAKSILKTPSTIGQKRKLIDMDLASDISVDSMSEPGGSQGSGVGGSSQPPPKKRARVKFQMDLMDISERQRSRSGTASPNAAAAAAKNSKEKSTALVREEIRRAIVRHVAGDSEAYDRIREVFTADPKNLGKDGSPLHELPTPTTLRNHLLGLLANVSALDSNCNGLVHAVLSSEWVGRDESYVKLFVKFLGTLAAARGVYLQSVLMMLVGNLRHVPNSVRKLPDYAVIHTSEVYRRIHLALQYIVQLIPAGSAALATTLSSGFPTATDTAKAHIAYTRNLLKITSYAPELKAEILALITEKIVKTDVQVQVDMEDLEEEMEDDILQSLSSAEDIALGDDKDSDGESVDSVEEELDAESDKLKMTKTNLHKIDYMMDMLFEYYAMPFAAGSLDDQENTLQLLLAHFENIILPTYRSRHSQFLLFHFAQSSPILVDRFSAACIQIIFSKSHPTLIRQYAAAYLASFVARGKHVSGEVVRDVFDLIAGHLHSLLIEYEPGCRGPDLRRYGTFYSMAQALLYIFCFRWRDLTTAALEEEEDKKGRSLDNIELDEVRFPPNITETMREAVSSALNPLKVCSPAIVEEFARLAHHLDFLYVYSIIEMNKRVRVQSSRGFTSRALNAQFGQIERETRADDNQGVQLDSYFPFDPYHLRRSGRWLEGDYVAWRGLPGLQNRDDDSDSRGTEEEFMEDEAEESDERVSS